jgi:hypothetical protein
MLSMKRNFAVYTYILIALLLIASPAVCNAQVTHTITVNEYGSFKPNYLVIHEGDSVVWKLHNATDSIIPVINPKDTKDVCSAYKPYHPNDANEFTGPMPRAASGIFTLGPMDDKSPLEEATSGYYSQGFKEEVGKMHALSARRRKALSL